MSISEEQHRLIIRYLDQDLSEEEGHLFDAYLRDSPDFRKELESSQILIAGVKAVEKAEEIAQIKNAFKEFDVAAKREKSVSKRRIITLGIAASIVMAMCISYLFLREGSLDKSLALYQEYYEVFPAEAQTRSGQTSRDALLFYENGQYIEAISLLQTQPSVSSDPLIPIYLANAYLQTNEPEKAISILKDHLPPEKEGYTAQFYHWYLAMAHLKSGQTEKAVAVFSFLTERKGIYQQQAAELLTKLK